MKYHKRQIGLDGKFKDFGLDLAYLIPNKSNDNEKYPSGFSKSLPI